MDDEGRQNYERIAWLRTWGQLVLSYNLVNTDYCQSYLTTGRHLDLPEKPASVNHNDESDYGSNSSYESGYGFDYFENFWVLIGLYLLTY